MGLSACSATFPETKQCDAIDALEGKDVIQRDLDSLERSACVSLMKFNEAKVLCLGLGNPKHKHRLGTEQIDSSHTEKDLGFWWIRNST